MNQSFHERASLSIHTFFVLACIGMIGFSLYLTQHYFNIYFPDNLTSNALCDMGAFFNCDITTLSPLSNIKGIPISIFGAIMGVFGLGFYMVKTEEYAKNLNLLFTLNAIGCLVLFGYSLFFLGGLCPFCSLYYVCAFIASGILFKYKTPIGFSPKWGSLQLLTLALIGGLVLNNVQGKEKRILSLKKDLIKQYDELPNLGLPSFSSEFRTASATEEFAQAPIQITKFSDFQCPACKHLSETLTKVKRAYKGKINIQYFFYPLDMNCNPEMKRPMHEFACQAAYLATCLPQKFTELEHTFFENQNKINKKWLDNYAKKEGVEACYNAPETKEKVKKMLTAAAPFNVRSTPTFLLNGVKIEGGLPFNQLTILLDHILEKYNNGQK